MTNDPAHDGPGPSGSVEQYSMTMAVGMADLCHSRSQNIQYQDANSDLKTG